MNSIVRPRRTDPEAIASRIPRRSVATALATVLLSVILVSFRPFDPAGSDASGGDVVNQIGFSALGGAALFSLFTFVDRRKLASLVSPWWLLMLSFFMLSVLNATDPASAFRTAMFTFIGIMTMAAIVAVPRDADAFATMLSVAGIAVVLICYAGLVLYPDIAIHTSNSAEPQHSGLWRGLFSHKNVAGPVMAALSFAGLYLFRRGRHWSGGFLFLAALFFLSNTGSKTTAGIVPLAILLVMGPGFFGLRKLVPVLFAGGLVLAAVATVGIVIWRPLWDLSQELSPGLTYTGRTALWSFSLEMLGDRPWTGYGYESFWGTTFLLNQDQPFDRTWDIRTIVHGHNGYLDIAVLMGIPALVVAIITFLLVPMVDFLRVENRRENVLLADLFMMILMFTAFNAFLESFFFRRADPVWLFFVLATFGLRYVARFPILRRIPD